MFPMSSFDDTYTPLPPITETQPNVPGPTFTSLGCFEGLVNDTAKSIALILNESTGYQNYNYGIATAVMVQEVRETPSGVHLLVYPFFGSQAFRYTDPTKGPNASVAPYFIARNRVQLENMYLQTNGPELGLVFQFYIGNPNVGPA